MASVKPLTDRERETEGVKGGRAMEGWSMTGGEGTVWTGVQEIGEDRVPSIVMMEVGGVETEVMGSVEAGAEPWEEGGRTAQMGIGIYMPAAIRGYSERRAAQSNGCIAYAAPCSRILKVLRNMYILLSPRSWRIWSLPTRSS